MGNSYILNKLIYEDKNYNNYYKIKQLLNNKKYRKKRNLINNYEPFQLNMLNVRDTPWRFIPPLHLATWLGKEEIVYLLLKNPQININLEWDVLKYLQIKSNDNKLMIDMKEKDAQYAINLTTDPVIIQLFVKSGADKSTFSKKTLDIIKKKHDIKKARKKLKKQAKLQKERSKKAVEKTKKERNRNRHCKNDIEFILQEDIDNFKPEELYNIKLGKYIYCLERNSVKGLLKYSQPVQGNCKQKATDNRGPIGCEDFYPINLGFNIYISEKDRNVALTEWLDDKKITGFVLKDKKVIDFTTGLHIVSQKTGNDNVYKLVPEYQKGGGRKMKNKKLVRKHKGINQQNGRLKKGYKYSGKKLKSGLSQIIKC